MVPAAGRRFGLTMRKKANPSAKAAESLRSHGPVQPESARGPKNALPRFGAQGPDGEQDPMNTVRNWRPGDAARRAYEKAVEEWWWL
jgi:hypothetical protein